MGQDICAIDRNMREILKHITNVSKMVPLEPLVPLTPVTPSVSNKSKSSFEFSDMTLNDSPNQDAKTFETSTGTGSPQLSDTSPNTSEFKPPFTMRHIPTDCMPGIYHNVKRRSSLQVPLLLNPHELVTRRYSDGTEDKNRTIYPGIVASKSENNFVCKTSKFRPFRKFSQISNKEEEYPLTSKDFNENCKLSSKGSSDFMNSLEDVHSPSCNSPLLGRQFSNSCDTALNHTTDNTADGKGSVCMNRERIPSVDANRQYSTNNCQVSFGILKEDQQHKTPGSVLSKSCADITNTHKKLQRVVKTKSQGYLETEFGTRTPNDIRTVHFLSNDDIFDAQVTKSSAEHDESENITAPVDVDVGYQIAEFNQRLGSSPNVFIKDYPTAKFSERFGESSQENLRTDSGNVSLLDTPEGKPTDFNAEQLTTSFNQSEQIHDRRKQMFDNPCEQELCKDVSPDSLTDISESLKTDSIRTDDDDTVLDIEIESVDMNGILNRVLESTSMRSTNL